MCAVLTPRLSDPIAAATRSCYRHALLLSLGRRPHPTTVLPHPAIDAILVRHTHPPAARSHPTLAAAYARTNARPVHPLRPPPHAHLAPAAARPPPRGAPPWPSQCPTTIDDRPGLHLRSASACTPLPGQRPGQLLHRPGPLLPRSTPPPPQSGPTTTLHLQASSSLTPDNQQWQGVVVG
jgi:hypothetical protein